MLARPAALSFRLGSRSSLLMRFLLIPPISSVGRRQFVCEQHRTSCDELARDLTRHGPPLWPLATLREARQSALTFSWRFADDLTAIAHKHLIPNDIPCPMGELRREQMAAFRSILSSCGIPPRAPGAPRPLP
jgi:hypothetical protein